MSIKLGPLDIAKMEATRFTLNDLTSLRDTGWCWHNWDTAKCPHRECGYRDLLAVLAAADAWLAAHPRGHIDILPDERGRIVTASEINVNTGEASDGFTGFAPTLIGALGAAFREGDQIQERKPIDPEIEVWKLTTRAQARALESLPADGGEGQLFITWENRQIDCRVTRPGRVGTATRHNTMLGAIVAAMKDAGKESGE